MTFSATTPFTVGDELLSSAWGEDAQLVVVSSSGSINVVSQVYDYRVLGAGLAVTGKRTSATIPLRTISNTATSDNIVVGDTLSYTGFSRPLQVLYVNVAPDSEGNLQSVPNSITVDESFTWKDDISLPEAISVARRWVPAEVPVADVTDVLIPTTAVQYLSSNAYDNQDFLRSAMVQNNMYLTDGNNEVYKYDGNNLYRAGIIPWQPGLFSTVESNSTGGIPLVGFAAVVVQALTGDKLEVSKVDSLKFRVNDTYIFANASGFTQYLTLESNVEKDASNHYLTFKEPLQFTALGTTPTLALVFFARYYFRLNIKDVNGVVTTSAVTGAEDFVITVQPTIGDYQRVHLRLVGMPAWDQYDFRNKNIELAVYRTFWSTTGIGETPVFYRLPQTRACSFVGADGYIDIIDTYSNDVLSEQDVVVGTLSPSTIPAAWDEPPRAKYTTTAGNRLVLGNLTDWPTLSLSYLPTTSISESAFDNQKIQFLKSVDSTVTTTDMVNSVIYQYVQPILTPTTPITGTWTNNSPTIVVSSATDVNVGASITGTGIASNTTITSVSGTTLGLSINTTSAQSSPTAVTIGNYHTATALAYDSATKLVTVTCANHGRVSGDWVYFFRTAVSDGMNTSLCGWWQVSLVNSSTFTIKWIPSNGTTSLTIADEATRFCHAVAGKDVPVWLGVDYNMSMVNGQVVGFKAPEIRVIRRLGMAVNATMRMVDTTIVVDSVYPYKDFKPWLVARSESDTGGQLIIKQPRAEIDLPAVKVLSTISGAGTFINNNLTSNTVAVPAAITRYPSRLAVSYDNYPEIFDNLWTVDTGSSDSIIDINSSDGQEITGIIPFFGESAFGAALQSGVLVVFKQNSIYLVDLGAKAAGQNAVQRLETQGLGCTAPYSIAPTKDGIAFANDSGIYVLRRNQRIEYLGRFIERNWQEKVDKNFLDIVQGHHYSVGRQYKLSVPMIEDSTSSYAENSQVYVYNHTGEADGETGGWARDTNHPATGWANLFKDAFYANVNGSVLRLRNLGEQTDYRDAASAIESILEARAISFGNTGIRKVVSNCIIHYRTAENSSGTKVYFAPDLYSEYDESTNFSVKTKSAIQDNLSSSQAQAIVSVMHSLVRRRCVFMSVKIINNTKDENVEVAGMSFVVGGLASAGIKQAAET